MRVGQEVFEPGRPAGDGGGFEGVQPEGLDAGQYFPQGPADDVVVGQARYPLEGRVGVEDAEIAGRFRAGQVFEQQEGVEHAAEQLAVALFAAAQFLLGVVLEKGHLHGGAQPVLVDGLEHIAVGGRAFGPLEGDLIGVGGEVDDRNVAFVLDDAGRFHAVHVAAQEDVHEHEVRTQGAAQVHGLGPRGRDAGQGVAQAAHNGLEIQGHDAFVLDDQQAGGAAAQAIFPGCFALAGNLEIVGDHILSRIPVIWRPPLQYCPFYRHL